MPGEITHFTSLLCSLALSRSQINQAQRLLSQLQERISGEEASSALNWFRVDMILESTSLTANTKFYALQILESAIKYRWKTLPAEQARAAARRTPHAARADAEPREGEDEREREREGERVRVCGGRAHTPR